MDIHGWRRLLFVRADDPETLPSVTPLEDFIVTVLVRKRSSVSEADFRNWLERDLAGGIRRAKSRWMLEACQIQEEISRKGILTFFLRMTRSCWFVRLLCRIQRCGLPDRYRTGYRSPYDAVIECRFRQEPDLETVAELSAMCSSLKHVEEATRIASRSQYLVYDSAAAGRPKRVTLCFLINRPAGMTRHACQSYWKTRHAELALKNMRYLNLARYTQVHAIIDPGDEFDDQFDGLAYAEKRSLGQLLSEEVSFNTFRFNNTVVMDELHFSVNTPVLLLRPVASC